MNNLANRQKCKIVSIAQVEDGQWNEWVRSLDDGHLGHTAELLHYYDAINVDGLQKASFAVFDSSNQLIAICPFNVHTTRIAGREWREATFSGAPCGCPALHVAPANKRRRVIRRVFQILDDLCGRLKLHRIVLHRAALSFRTSRDTRPIFALEANESGYVSFSQSVLCADLRKNEEDLFNQMNAEHRKRIRQTTRKGITVRALRGGKQPSIEDSNDIARLFRHFRQAHFTSAGRETRSERSWELMLEYAIQGKATLFVAFLREIPISFLYCGEFLGHAAGWSQVNVESYEVDYSPRHLLEWEAMRDYRRRGFEFYEIGVRYKKPNLFHVPSEKEISISDFKERYGAEPWPESIFEKYFDLELQDLVFRQRYADFRSALEVRQQSGLLAVDPLDHSV